MPYFSRLANQHRISRLTHEIVKLQELANFVLFGIIANLGTTGRRDSVDEVTKKPPPVYNIHIGGRALPIYQPLRNLGENQIGPGRGGVANSIGNITNVLWFSGQDINVQTGWILD